MTQDSVTGGRVNQESREEMAPVDPVTWRTNKRMYFTLKAGIRGLSIKFQERIM